MHPNTVYSLWCLTLDEKNVNFFIIAFITLAYTLVNMHFMANVFTETLQPEKHIDLCACNRK